MILTIQTTVEARDLRITNVSESDNIHIIVEFEPKYQDGVKNNTVTARNLIRQSPELRQVVKDMIKPYVKQHFEHKRDARYNYNYNVIGIYGKKVHFNMIFSYCENALENLDQFIEDVLLTIR